MAQESPAHYLVVLHAPLLLRLMLLLMLMPCLLELTPLAAHPALQWHPRVAAAQQRPLTAALCLAA
jgi:hypothetical protein